MTIGDIIKSMKGGISTHTLTWSVTSAFGTISSSNCYFNSHAHVERDSTTIEGVLPADISTHTLTWSVTIGYLARL